MIQLFVDRFMERKPALRAHFSKEPPEEYSDIVKAAVKTVTDADDDYLRKEPDPERVHQVDDGDYRGTLVFVIGAKGYRPSTYWYVLVSYGSCSGCDTLEAAKWDFDSGDENKRLDAYMTMALHVVQGLKLMAEEVAAP